MTVAVQVPRARAKMLGLRALSRFRRFQLAFKYSPDQPRDERGRWTEGSGDEGPSFGASPDVLLAAARGRRALEAECDAQYKRDIFQCKMVGLPACYAQAMARLQACLNGRPIPPLNY